MRFYGLSVALIYIYYSIILVLLCKPLMCNILDIGINCPSKFRLNERGKNAEK